METGLGPLWTRCSQSGRWDGAEGRREAMSRSGPGGQGWDCRAVIVQSQSPRQSHDPLPTQPCHGRDHLWGEIITVLPQAWAVTALQSQPQARLPDTPPHLHPIHPVKHALPARVPGQSPWRPHPPVLSSAPRSRCGTDRLGCLDNGAKSGGGNRDTANGIQGVSCSCRGCWEANTSVPPLPCPTVCLGALGLPTCTWARQGQGTCRSWTGSIGHQILPMGCILPIPGLL